MQEEYPRNKVKEEYNKLDTTSKTINQCKALFLSLCP